MLCTRRQARAPAASLWAWQVAIGSICSCVAVVAVICHVVLCFGIFSALALRNDRRQVEKLRGKSRLSGFVYLFL